MAKNKVRGFVHPASFCYVTLYYYADKQQTQVEGGAMSCLIEICVLRVLFWFYFTIITYILRTTEL